MAALLVRLPSQHSFSPPSEQPSDSLSTSKTLPAQSVLRQASAPPQVSSLINTRSHFQVFLNPSSSTHPRSGQSCSGAAGNTGITRLTQGLPVLDTQRHSSEILKVRNQRAHSLHSSRLFNTRHRSPFGDHSQMSLPR